MEWFVLLVVGVTGFVILIVTAARDQGMLRILERMEAAAVKARAADEQTIRDLQEYLRTSAEQARAYAAEQWERSRVEARHHEDVCNKVHREMRESCEQWHRKASTSLLPPLPPVTDLRGS